MKTYMYVAQEHFLDCPATQTPFLVHVHISWVTIYGGRLETLKVVWSLLQHIFSDTAERGDSHRHIEWRLYRWTVIIMAMSASKNCSHYTVFKLKTEEGRVQEAQQNTKPMCAY